MKLYVVESGYMDDYSLAGVSTDRGLAEQAARDHRDDAEVREVEANVATVWDQGSRSCRPRRYGPAVHGHPDATARLGQLRAAQGLDA